MREEWVLGSKQSARGMPFKIEGPTTEKAWLLRWSKRNIKKTLFTESGATALDAQQAAYIRHLLA